LAKSSNVGIKWINDIYIEEKKVAGCLVKAEFGQNEFVAQIGIGVNLNVAPS
jgi:biotin-(acetyl-CoA carboxylase) ligase